MNNHRVLAWRDSKVLFKNSGNLVGKFPFWLYLGNFQFLLEWIRNNSKIFLIVEPTVDKDRMSTTVSSAYSQNPYGTRVSTQSNDVSWFWWQGNTEEKIVKGKLPYNELELQGSNIIKTVH